LLICWEFFRGYPSNAQQYDSRLRPPVEDRELEIDDRNGMKKYIASEGEGFETSTECIRKHLEKSIELGRRKLTWQIIQSILIMSYWTDESFMSFGVS
jgi:hypothetical protein